jgi:cystathionine beta-synthase
VLAARDPALPPLVHTHPEETVREAIEILREYDVSQLPVVKHEPPVVLAEVVGAVTERDLMEQVFSDASALDRAIGDVMGEPLPTIGIGEQVQVAVDRLEKAPALLVLDRGHPVGVITRSDVLAALAGGQR